MANKYSRSDWNAMRLIPDEKERYDTIDAAVRETRFETTERLHKCLDEHHYTSKALCDIIGFDPSAMCRVLQRDFSMNVSSLNILAYDVQHTSVQEFLFGEALTVELPKSITMFVNDAEEGGKDYITRFRDDVRSFAKSVTGNTEKNTAHPNIILKSRIIEYAGDRGVAPMTICSETAHTNVKNNLKRIIGAGPDFSPTVYNLMMLSVYTGQPADYFISPDYAKYNKIRPYGSRPRSSYTVMSMCSGISEYLLLPLEYQKRFFAQKLSEKIFR